MGKGQKEKDYLISSIVDLQKLNAELQKKEELKAADLQQAIVKSEALLLAMRTAAQRQMRSELRDFINAVLNTIEELSEMTAKKLPPPVTPNALLHEVTTSFGRFVDRAVTPTTFRKIRDTVTFTPYVGGTLTLIYTLPTRWNNSSNRQKISLVLGALLVLACLAFTIALWTTPAIATVPFIGTAVTCVSACAIWLYKTTVTEVDEKTKEKKMLQDTLGALKTQQKSLRALLKICPPANNPEPAKVVVSVRRRTALTWGRRDSKKSAFVPAVHRSSHTLTSRRGRR